MCLRSTESTTISNESPRTLFPPNQGDEGRALLAIALHRHNIMTREKEQLLREIDAPIKERAFDPGTLSSMTRAEAIRALAFDIISPKIWTKKRSNGCARRMLAADGFVRRHFRRRKIFGLLLEFKSMIGAENAPALNATQPTGVASKNGRSIAWLDLKIGG